MEVGASRSGVEGTRVRDSQRSVQTDPALRELRARDREVRAHEQAHATVGGPYAGSPAFTVTLGPDGRAYAVGGSVQLDTTPVPDDPAATVDKMEQIARAALAPAEPSAQDLRVAQQAQAEALQARGELLREAPDADSSATEAFAEVEAMASGELMRQGGRLDLFA